MEPEQIPLEELDAAYAAIMREIVATGIAPHYAELARTLGIEPMRAKAVIARIIDLTPGWMHPGTDWIASFPPFNNQPTQYRVSVDGEQRWFAQCGFEALACRWLFGGRTVRVDAPCLLGGEPLRIEMRDEEILSIDPPTMVGLHPQPCRGRRRQPAVPLSGHEPLPVGRARPRLGGVRSPDGGHAAAGGMVG